MSDDRLPLDADDLYTMRASSRPAGIHELAFDIEIVDGPERGARLTIDAQSSGRVLIGQSPVCEIKLTDRAASRRHASLELSERGLRLTDLGSTNGTSVGPLSVVQLFLQGGETIGIGRTKIHVTARRVAAPPQPADASDRFGRLIGSSFEMRKLYPLCARLARSPVPVIIEGETGTGKEVLAESIHEQGDRAAGPFIVFDCAGITPGMVESELFGHEAGAFPGAGAARKGLFERAHGGTLFIDEVGELDTTIQPKLLRAIERSEIRRVGADQPIRVDVRVLASTRRDLDREVVAGRFRDDLFHRLAVGRIELPPLRRRREDIALLARHFCALFGAPSDPLDARVGRQLRRWQDDPWPGNVRELRNAVARQLAYGDLPSDEEEAIASEADPAAPASSESGDDLVERILRQRLPFGQARARMLEAFTSRYIRQALADHGGNVARAAASSGIGRRYFQRIKSRQADGDDDE
jgi:DNA-binding NtrC family response regulator